MAKGKMPEGLKRYWANKRKGKGTKMARRYFGRKKGGRVSRTVPIMGVVTLGTLAGNILASGNKSYGMLSPIDSLTKYGPGAFGVNVTSKLSQPSTYTPVLIPLALWIGGRMLLGKKPLGKRVSIF